MEITGEARIRDRMQIGNNLMANSSVVMQAASVGCNVQMAGSFQFTDLAAGNEVVLQMGGKGRSLSAGSSILSKADLILEGKIAAGQSITVEGLLRASEYRGSAVITARRIELESLQLERQKMSLASQQQVRAGELHGHCRAKKALLEEGAFAEYLHADEVVLHAGARVGSVYARRVRLEGAVEIQNEIVYTEKLDSLTQMEKVRQASSLPEFQ
jgi:hypothetical protein